MIRKLIALLAIPSIAVAQQARLQLRVESQGHPVVQAQVMTGIDITATNAVGVARLMLGSGTHLVRVRHASFRTDSFRVTLARGADTTVKVELHPVIPDSEPVFVTSARGIRRLEDDPVRVDVVDREAVLRKTEMRPQDLKGFFTGTPGVRVQPTSAATGAAGVRLQGLKPRYSLMLADGLPLYGNGGIGLDLLQIPPADLEQIEVIKGPASALYGSNALAGTINLISRRPGNETNVLAHGTSESGGNLFGFSSKRFSDRFGHTTLVGAHYQDARDGDGDTWKELPEVHRFELRPRLFFNSPDGGSAFVTFGTTIERRNGGFVNDLAPDGSSYSERVATRRADVGLNVIRVTGASSVVQFRGSYNLNAVDHEFFDVAEDARRSTGFGELSYSFTDQYNQFLVGAAFDADMAEVKGPSASSANGTPIDYTYLTPALFLQNTFSITDHVWATAIARGDMHSKYGTFFSPRLSMLIKPAANWSVRLSGAHGFNAPTPFIEEVDPVGVHRVNGFESDAPRAVGAETADHGSVDVGATLGGFDLSGAVFATVLHHPVIAIPASGGRYSLVNSEFAHSARGIELSGAFGLGPLRINGLYTYTDSRERSSLTSKVESAAPYVPRHTGGADISWRHATRGTRIALGSFFTSRQLLNDDPALEVSKPYAVTGIQMSQKVGRFKLFANIENLTDVRQTKYAPVVLPARATDGRWTATPWAPLEGRTFSIGVRIPSGNE